MSRYTRQNENFSLLLPLLKAAFGRSFLCKDVSRITGDSAGRFQRGYWVNAGECRYAQSHTITNRKLVKMKMNTP